ncbi:MAG: hypothetical protein ACTHJ2_09435 [Candidatus Nitrosocosmicus sp.]
MNEDILINEKQKKLIFESLPDYIPYQNKINISCIVVDIFETINRHPGETVDILNILVSLDYLRKFFENIMKQEMMSQTMH